MIMSSSIYHLPSSTVLNTLKLFNLILRQAVEKRVTVIQPTYNKCMYKGLCALLRQKSSNASNVSYMIKGRLTNRCHLFLEVNHIIHGDPNIACSISTEDIFRSKSVRVSSCGLGRCCEEITTSSVLICPYSVLICWLSPTYQYHSHMTEWFQPTDRYVPTRLIQRTDTSVCHQRTDGT